MSDDRISESCNNEFSMDICWDYDRREINQGSTIIIFIGVEPGQVN
jgi:hypothetical protein